LTPPRLGGDLGHLTTNAWGRFLETKTSLAMLAVALTAVHTYAGSRTDSPRWVLASRLILPLAFVDSIAIFWLAVRMTEG
jgi:hypothetical protein